MTLSEAWEKHARVRKSKSRACSSPEASLVRVSTARGRLLVMASKPTPAPVASPTADDDDPVRRAAAAAPLDDVPQTEEERAEIARRKANPVLVRGQVVTAMLADRRRRQEG